MFIKQCFHSGIIDNGIIAALMYFLIKMCCSQNKHTERDTFPHPKLVKLNNV